MIKFEWDEEKAISNLNKHGVSFLDASTIFRDPNIVTIPDVEHSQSEERWISIGLSQTRNMLVVCHLHYILEGETIVIRIYSARKATKVERNSYTGKR